MEGFDADIRIIDFCVRSKKYNFKIILLFYAHIFNFTPILLNFKILHERIIYGVVRTLR